jgi:hypothetical protein
MIPRGLRGLQSQVTGQSGNFGDAANHFLREGGLVVGFNS